MGDGMVDIAVIGDVPPQTPAILSAVAESGHTFAYIKDDNDLWQFYEYGTPLLVIVAGYRRLIPKDELSIPRYGTVGFHSARLPEYPGRAPVPWALIRGDDFTYNTMFFLDEGVDTGDVIDERRIRIYPSDTPEVIYHHIARTGAEMLRQHLPALLDGTAPRTPQDPARRGPLTTADGWAIWQDLQRLGAGHG